MAEVPAQNCASFEWDQAREEAAALVAEGRWTDQEVGEKVGVCRRTICAWKRYPVFQARVRELVALIGDAAAIYAIANKLRRLEAQNQRWELLEQVRQERAADPELGKVPGGKTGLLAPQAQGPPRLDKDALKEQRLIERQAAEEMGQLKTDAPTVQANVFVTTPREVLLALPPEEQLRLLTGQ
jgi:hypothetical protein